MECPGATKCSDGDVCFAEHARKRATEADVLIVNHALYCVHLDSSGAVLPEHDLVIFDEAHGLADVATTTFGIDVTPAGLRQLASRLTGVGRGPHRRRPPRPRPPTRSTRAIEAADGRVDPTEGAFADALGVAAERLAGAIPSIDASGDPNAAAQTNQLAAARLAALRRMRAPDTDEVVWVERDAIHLAPIDVSRALAARLFATTPTVLTSATLGGGARFATFTRRLGLDPDAEPGPITVRTPTARRCSCPGSGTSTSRSTPRSTSAPRRSSTCPRHLPEPRDPTWGDAAAAETDSPRRRRRRPRADPLHVTRRGRAHGRAAARRHRPSGARPGRDVEGGAARAVRGRGDVVSRRDPQLLDRRRHSRARAACSWCSTGCRSPGPTTRSRRRGARRPSARAAPGFGDVDLPAAALVLAQGAGRLIRTVTDRGVVAVLDRRLATAGYRDGAPRRAAADAPGRRPGDRRRVPRDLHRVTGRPPGR